MKLMDAVTGTVRPSSGISRVLPKVIASQVPTRGSSPIPSSVLNRAVRSGVTASAALVALSAASAVASAVRRRTESA